MRRPTGAFVGLVATGLALAALPAAVAATSTTVVDVKAVVYVVVGILLVWGVALVLWTRPPDRRIAKLLFVLAAAYAVRGLAASDAEWVYTMSRTFGRVAEFVLVWVMLAFPAGRLRARRDRLIVAATAVTSVALWIPVVLFSPEIPLAGALVPCDDQCPGNALLVSDAPTLAAFFETTFRISSVVILVAVALSLLDRLLHASRLTRRTLAPLLVVSIVRTLAVAAFVATGAAALTGVVLVALFWAVPLSMALGLLLGRLYTAAALQRLVSGLQRRPDADELRAVMADALEDRTLNISYWLPEQSQWLDATGTLTDAPPAAGRDQAVTFARQPDSAPVAAIVHDEVLLEQPALLGAVTASTRFALESNRLQAELSLADQRVADARTRGRRDLERDLHDGAQQRLIALRMKVSVLTRLLDTDVHRAGELAAELGPDIDATLQEVRELGQGRGPRLLVDSGLDVALATAVRNGPLPGTFTASGLTRYPDEVEGAVYFTCLEALQNAGKHAGAEASVDVTVADDGQCLTFAVADTGRTSPVTTTFAGRGMANMRERIVSVGGTVDGTLSPTGMTVHGSVPVTRSA